MATNTGSIIIGIFQDQAQAQQAIDELRTAGFGDDQIRFAGHGTADGGLLASLRSLLTGQEPETAAPYEDLASLGIPEEDAASYQREYEAGRSIVTVMAGSRVPEAATILSRCGGTVATTHADQTPDESSTLAQTSDSAGTARIADTDATYAPESHGTTRIADTDATHAHDSAATPPDTQASVADTQGEQRLPLREERLQVQKHWIAASYVLIRKRVITEEKTFKVMVAREEVVIERYPPFEQIAGPPLKEEGQPTSQDETHLLQLAVGQTITIPLREEEVHIEKQPVVVEEVVIGKQALQETQQVSAVVEREVPRVQRTGTASIQDSSGTLSETSAPIETQAGMPNVPHMASTESQVTIASVFQDAGRAHLAMAALQGAGIRADQMQYSLPGFPANSFRDDLIAHRIPQEVATSYSQVFEQGGTIVLVRAPSSQQPDLLRLLHHYGASDVTSASEPVPASSTPATAASTTAAEQPSLQLREERLQVHKQPVQVGEVHVGKEVIREHQAREVPVTREEVMIERHEVDHRPSPTPIGPAEVYYLPLLAEDVFLQKQAVVKEELVVGKQVEQETQSVSETVRREEARIEPAGEVNIHRDDVQEGPSRQMAS
jgi:uncharacterized protein (TIGR02271 family)